MQTVDWAIVAAYCLFALGVGIYFSRRAGKSTTQFFVGGRALPWWIAGTSMVATTFAADTPLGITEVVRQGGIAGNWIYWNQLLGGMLAVFFFARLWRRAKVLTDVELVALRYSGRGASLLRGFKAVYFAFFYNCVVMGWVITAMVTILSVTTGISPLWGLAVCVSIALFYSVLSGFVGVVMTDLVQFGIAILGSILFAVLAVQHVGGIDGLEKKLAAQGRGEYVNFMPKKQVVEEKDAEGNVSQVTVWKTGRKTFRGEFILVAFGMVWWAAANADGGGYIVQRMLACKNERHALLATLWFNVANYAVRWWPWIMVALVSLALFPQVDGADNKAAYVETMMHEGIVPPVLMGLLFVSFLAAFMSTIDTHLNWATSLVINDIYRPFFAPDKDERHYVAASRISMVVMMGLGVGVSLLTFSISDAWKLLMTMGSGLGIVLIFRWLWWRVNAWSEIAAMSTSLVTMLILWFGFGVHPKEVTVALPIVVAVSFVVTLAVTFLTAPTDPEKLKTFYRRVQPARLGWGPVVRQIDPARLRPQRGLGHSIADWLAGSAMVYCAMFAIGHFIFGRLLPGALLGAGSVLCGLFLWVHLARSGGGMLDDEQPVA